MLGCLTTGVSGLSANNSDMSVIANNIANANTTAYKSQRSNFADVLSQRFGDLEVGSGVSVYSISSMSNQGPMNATNNVTDLAIDGAGFFVVKDNSGTYYTRAGQFHVDKDGKLVTPKGCAVQGWDLRSNSGTASLPSDIDISDVSLPPKATETISMGVNLASDDDAITATFDLEDSTTYNKAFSVPVYDDLGNAHNVTLYFQKTAEDQWTWYASDGGTYLDGQTGNLDFTAESLAEGTITIDGLSMTIDFSDTTQFGSTYSMNSIDQDGYEAGSLKRISVTQQGVIQAILTNGRAQDIALIALADFKDPDGLMKVGDNLYLFTPQSGQPVINPPETGGKGRILAYYLEGSNVDLAAEFVRMIVTQRAFQANARTITTADQMLTELVNLKR
ncbi:MAG: flagellar hook protein FlgE [bacterium]